jgi:hypothetical protein
VFGRHTLYFSLSSVYRVSITLRGYIAYPIVQKHTLGEGSAHDHAAHAGRSIEVLLAALSPAGVEVGVDLRHRGGVVDGEGWVVGFVVFGRSSSSQDTRAGLTICEIEVRRGEFTKPEAHLGTAGPAGLPERCGSVLARRT